MAVKAGEDANWLEVVGKRTDGKGIETGWLKPENVSYLDVDIAADLGKGLGAEPPGDAHQFDRFRVFDLWPHVRSNARFADVLGACDRRRHSPNRAHCSRLKRHGRSVDVTTDAVRALESLFC